MFCDFRKAFGLDPEYNKQLEESMQGSGEESIKRKVVLHLRVLHTG